LAGTRHHVRCQSIRHRKAQQNIRANHVAPRVRISCEAGGKSHRLPCGTCYELVLVDLNHAELAAYSPALARAAMPGGMVVLSGLGNYHERYVATAYAAHGFTLRNILRQDGWSSVVIEAWPHRTSARSPNLRCIPLAPPRPTVSARPSPAPSLRAVI